MNLTTLALSVLSKKRKDPDPDEHPNRGFATQTRITVHRVLQPENFAGKPGKYHGMAGILEARRALREPG